MRKLLFLLLTLCSLLSSPGLSGASRAKNLGTAASSRGSDTGHSGPSGPDGVTRLTAECADHCQRRQCSSEQAAKEALLCGYDRTSRPVINDSTQIRVHIAVALFHILDTDEKHQTFSALMSIRLRWTDQYLTWDPEDYNGTTNLHIPSSAIWTPDIVISNSADESSKKFMTTNTVAWHNGSVLWMFPAVVKVTCTLNVRYFPFDRQTCMITFISWTYHLFEVDVWHDESVDANKNYYLEDNQEWNVSSISFSRTEGVYACCKEPWPDVTIVIDMTRRSLFYVFNLIFPCLLMYLASFLGFFLPIETGEKVNLELTILLALVVFLLIVGDTLPPTPDAIPLVGILFGVTMAMVSLALMMGVLVTNIHVRKVTSSGPPPWPVRLFVSLLHCRECRRRRRVEANRRRHRHRRLAALNGVTAGVRFRFPHSVALDEDSVGSIEDESCQQLRQRAQQPKPRANGNGALSPTEQPEPTTGRLTRLPSHLSLLDYEAGADEGLTKKKKKAHSPRPESKSRTSEGSDECICHGPEAWVAMARSTDRAMFWLFLVASTAVMAVIYWQVPSYASVTS